MRGTQVSLKNTLVSLKSTQVSSNSSPVSLTVNIYVGGCSCLATLHVLFMPCTSALHASHVWLAWPARLARWLAHWPHSYLYITGSCVGTVVLSY